MKCCKGCGSNVRDEMPRCQLCGCTIFENECVPLSIEPNSAAKDGTWSMGMHNLFARTGTPRSDANHAASPRGSTGPVSIDSLLAQTGAAGPVSIDMLFTQMNNEPDSESARVLHFAPSHSLNGEMCVIGASALLPPMLEIPSRYKGMPVTEIASQALAHKKIVSVHIPETVQYIGDNAFENCRSLIQVTGCAGLSMIGHRAFSGCLHLTQFDFPEPKPIAHADSFAGCFDSGMALEAHVTLAKGEWD